MERLLLGAATVLVVNVCVLIGSLAVVTVPLALSAGLESIARWRTGNGEHNVASFISAYRRHVCQKMVVGWSCLGLVGWGWLVAVEGLSLRGVWRVAVAAVGCGELAVAIPILWMGLLLVWTGEGSPKSLVWAAVILAVRMPWRCLLVSLVTVASALIVGADPALVLVGLVATLLWWLEMVLEKGLLARGVRLALPE